MVNFYLLIRIFTVAASYILIDVDPSCSSPFLRLSIIIIVFQATLISLVPVIGPPFAYLHLALLYSLYAFEYTWMNLGEFDLTIEFISASVVLFNILLIFFSQVQISDPFKGSVSM